MRRLLLVFAVMAVMAAMVVAMAAMAGPAFAGGGFHKGYIPGGPNEGPFSAGGGGAVCFQTVCHGSQ